MTQKVVDLEMGNGQLNEEWQKLKKNLETANKQSKVNKLKSWKKLK